MKKVLIVAHVSGFVPQFEMNNVRILQSLGYEVHYASNFRHVHYGEDNRHLEGTGIVQHQVDFSRSPFNVTDNLRAYRQLRQLMKQYRFEMVHCHTPVGAVYGRLAARKYRKKGTRVLYTAHGFHFYKGASFCNYMISYPMERLLARCTDTLITINEEDYRNACRFTLGKRDGRKGTVHKISGVGIDLARYEYAPGTRERMRIELGIAQDAFVLISVGELNRNKNHGVVVDALGRLKNKNIHYVICGEGEERDALTQQAERLGLGDSVTLTGFRTNIPELLSMADGMVFPSLREGLGMAALEALASGVPVIASDNRGTREYMQDGVNGYVVKENTPAGLAEAIERLYRLPEDAYKEMKCRCSETAERFGSEQVKRKMTAIYQDIDRVD